MDGDDVDGGLGGFSHTQAEVPQPQTDLAILDGGHGDGLVGGVVLGLDQLLSARRRRHVEVAGTVPDLQVAGVGWVVENGGLAGLNLGILE